jgi:signal transduction histidine kinase
MIPIMDTGSCTGFLRKLAVIASLFAISLPADGQSGTAGRQMDSLVTILASERETKKVDVLNELSQVNWRLSYEKSMDFATQAFELASELGYPEGEADALNRIGNVHYFLGNHDSAIKNYQRACEISRPLDDFRRTGIYLNNIGLLYTSISEYDSSEVYLTKALREKEKHGDQELIASTLNNLAILYRNKQQYNLALQYNALQLDIWEKTRNSRNQARVHRQIGDLYYLRGWLNESLDHLLTSLNIARASDDSSSVARAYYLIARTRLELNDPGNAMADIYRSLEIASVLPSNSLLRDNKRLLFEYYKNKGDHKSAFENFISYSNLKDSIRIINSGNRFRQLEGIFETEKQNQEIDLLKKENLVQEMQLISQSDYKILLIILLVLLVSFKLIIIHRFWLIHRTNKALRHKIAQLEKTNQKLNKSARALEQLNAAKNRFFSIIAHDLKNPFNALLGFSEMISSNFNELKESELREYLGIVHQSTQNLFKLLENLLKWSASQTGSMHYLPDKFDLVSLIHSEMNLMRIGLARKQIDISVNLPDELMIISDKQMISTVIRNLLDNAVKFTGKGGSIRITARKENEAVYAEVADSGIGIPEDMKKKLFRLDSTTCRKGTEKEEGGGLGLILCKELILKANGEIGMTSNQEKGSKFWFRLPLTEESVKL